VAVWTLGSSMSNSEKSEKSEKSESRTSLKGQTTVSLNGVDSTMSNTVVIVNTCIEPQQQSNFVNTLHCRPEVHLQPK